MSANPLRRTVFIKKAFQGRFVAAVLLNILLFALVSAGLLYWLIGDDLQAGRYSASVSVESLWSKIGFIILAGNVVAGVIAGITATRTVIRRSHLIAGPLYRFEQVCRQVGEGQLDVYTGLRESDELKDLSTAFAGMVSGLRAAQERRDTALEQARIALDACGARLQSDPEALRHLAAARAALEPLRSA